MLTFLPEARTWSSPPYPMSYAQPSPPMIQTLFFTSMSARLRRAASPPASVHACELLLQLRHPLALVVDARLVRLVGLENAAGELVADRRDRAVLTSSRAISVCLSTVRRMPSPNSALSSNSELDQAGPAPVLVLRPGGGGEVAAVDRRATGRVRDDASGRRRAAMTSFTYGVSPQPEQAPGVLEERLQELRALHGVDLHRAGGPPRAARGRSRS